MRIRRSIPILLSLAFLVAACVPLHDPFGYVTQSPSSMDSLERNLEEMRKPAPSLPNPELVFTWEGEFVSLSNLKVMAQDHAVLFFEGFSGLFYLFDLQTGEKRLLAPRLPSYSVHPWELDWAPDGKKLLARNASASPPVFALVDFQAQIVTQCPTGVVWIGWKPPDSTPLFWDHVGDHPQIITTPTDHWQMQALSPPFPQSVWTGGTSKVWSICGQDQCTFNTSDVAAPYWIYDFGSKVFKPTDRNELSEYHGSWLVVERGYIPRSQEGIPIGGQSDQLWLLREGSARLLLIDSPQDPNPVSIFEYRVIGWLNRDLFLLLLQLHNQKAFYLCRILPAGADLISLWQAQKPSNEVVEPTWQLGEDNALWWIDTHHIYRLSLPSVDGTP